MASYAVVRFKLFEKMPVMDGIKGCRSGSNNISRTLALESIMRRISLYIRVMAVSQLKFLLKPDWKLLSEPFSSISKYAESYK